MAMALLSFRESVRRRVLLVVFAVFGVLLMFGGWFLDPATDHPARLYLSFVMTSSAYLVILLAVFLSIFSIPNDIKSRTIYTIVTRTPSRPRRCRRKHNNPATRPGGRSGRACRP
jgi:drug/metabolite transporter (DMT)-like permease